MKQFPTGEVIFINFTQNNKSKKVPGMIICKSGYGTYKIRRYGAKNDEYVCEYQIEKYSQEIAEQILQQSGKKNKKMIKYLKSAEKNFVNKQKPTERKQIFNLQCKEEEEEEQKKNQPSIQQKQPLLENYETLMSLKINTLIADHKATGITRYSCRQYDEGFIVQHRSKDLLKLRLQFALEDIYFYYHPDTLSLTNLNQAEAIIEQIFQSQIIQPIDYVTCSLFKYIKRTANIIKKNQRKALRNFLHQRINLIIKGIQVYLTNYTFWRTICMKYKEDFGDFKFNI